VAQAAIFAALGTDAARVVEHVRDSIVEVHTPGAGAGTGIIWRADGIVVTNHHVAPGPQVAVVLADGRRLPGTVVARDIDRDLAVVRVPASGLSPIERAEAGAVRPGSLVLAVGHPFGMRGAVTVGIVSRRPAGAEDRRWIVADVLLGPGNSGGPLVDATGRVVGVNAMVVGGRALAIPTDAAESMVRLSSEGRASAA
jgi:serine protease Do